MFEIACESRMRKSRKSLAVATMRQRLSCLTLIFDYQMITCWFGNRCVAIATIPLFYGLFPPNPSRDKPVYPTNQAAIPKG
jgi:hypothetical protein